jgi:hypothetical protein
MLKKRIFVSYSHLDEEWKEKVITHLKVIEAESNIMIWDDRKIAAGEDWLPEIEKQIALASVALLLLSANYLTSNFIIRKEVPAILRRRKKEGFVVIQLY